MKTLLRIDGSPRKSQSASRQLADVLQNKLEQAEQYNILHRDVYYDNLVKLGNEDSVTAYFTPEDQQSDTQKESLKASNTLSSEFASADTYVFAVPMYNFSVSAGLKTYIDLIARAGITFQYTENGPIGLLQNKKAYVIITTGGTKIGSEVDHVSQYMTTFLNFLGIKDIAFINSDLIMSNPEEIIKSAKTTIHELAV